ncbi:YlbF family regulator [Paenibacillus spongiae]|uniref:UPF0342 protein L1F29_08735 n=1 Tax=Paenibacillus spongiae TaxID=2909671 RepID=A0ABY5SD63_9BACL|nr:YlbF family regulator [Paenibacillus spongiae]UVI31884.1 YlbF family regulator [Paenibacillus spongiae]
MNVYDKAYELADALKAGEEAKALKEALQAVEADPDAKRMMDDFREKQEKLQQLIMSGEEPSPGEMEKMNKLYELISLNPHVNRLFEAERRFSVIYDDVNRIMSEALRSIVE